MTPRAKSDKQDELVRMKKLRRADAGIHLTDAISSFVNIQLMVFKQLIEKRNGPLFNSLLGYLFLPVAALAAVVNMVFTWRRAALRHFEGMALAKAVMATISAAAMLAVTIGLIVAAALFTVVGPLIYAAVVGFKALFSAGQAIYFGFKAYHANTDEAKADYKEKAVYAAVDATCGIIISGAMLTIFLVAAPAVQIAMTIMGVTASLVAYAFSRMKIKYPAENYAADSEAASRDDIDASPTLTNNAKLASSLQSTSSTNVSFDELHARYEPDSLKEEHTRNDTSVSDITRDASPKLR